MLPEIDAGTSDGEETVQGGVEHYSKSLSDRTTPLFIIFCLFVCLLSKTWTSKPSHYWVTKLLITTVM